VNREDVIDKPKLVDTAANRVNDGLGTTHTCPAGQDQGLDPLLGLRWHTDAIFAVSVLQS
jgi:hypothetical protein